MPNLQNLLDELGPKVSRAKERAKKEGPRYDNHETTRQAALASAQLRVLEPATEPAPVNVTGPDTKTAPVNVTGPDIKTAPVNVTGPDIKTAPVNVTGPDTKTAPVNVTGPDTKTAPVNVTGPDIKTAPVNVTGPDIKTAPVNVTGPDIKTAPVNVTGPDIKTAPVNVTGPDIKTAPVNVTGPDIKTAPVNVTGPDTKTAPVNATGPDTKTAPVNATGPDIKTAPDNLSALEVLSRQSANSMKPRELVAVGALPDWSAPWTHTQFFNPLLEWLADPKTDVSLREMRLLLYVARQTWGFHRQWIELKRADIARVTGYDEDNAKRATKRLIETGVLLCQQELGKTNRFALPVAVPPRRNAGADEQTGADKKTGRDPVDSAGLTPRRSNGPDESLKPFASDEMRSSTKPLKKFSKEISKKISLSETGSAAVEQFLATQHPNARERFFKLLEAMSSQFPDDLEDLANAPKALLRFGAPDGEPVVSPIGFLETSSWPLVRDFLRQKGRGLNVSSDGDRRHQAAKQRMEKDYEEETAAVLAFSAAFSDEEEQRAIFAEYGFHGDPSDRSTVQALKAIRAWHKDTQELSAN